MAVDEAVDCGAEKVLATFKPEDASEDVSRRPLFWCYPSYGPSALGVSGSPLASA